MKLLIETDQNIEELVIKFASNGNVNMQTQTSDPVELKQEKRQKIESSEDLISQPVILGDNEKSKEKKTTPKVVIPNTDNRDPSVEVTMNATF